jgi:hypothetical protein
MTTPTDDLAATLAHSGWCHEPDVTTGWDLFRHCRYARCRNCLGRAYGPTEPTTAGRPARKESA